MKIISYFFVRLMILFIGLMPFSILYLFSDVVYFFLFHLVGYRRKVVFDNLGRSFPAKTPDEILLLAKRYYHHLSDITLESLKGFMMSPNEIVRRHHIINTELADYYYNKGISAIAVTGHYNNWEWGSLSPGLQIKYPIIAFYKPMSNALFDNYAKKHRAKFNTKLASIRGTSATFEELAGTPNAFIMAADQSPSNIKDCYWINFLYQDTAWLHGPEKYARKFNLPVIFIDIQKSKRGFYELNLIVLAENPASLPDGEITRLYVQQLEKSILQEPAYWLWSHRRWKHKRG